ncbi:MAG: hypothetical protein LBH43_20650, partial [Treponema sp.]|nr:hypothetical protein [Treponema sp.]
FYPDIYDFHYFASKELTSAGVPEEKDVRWLGDEWEWDVDTYEEGWYQSALPKGWDRTRPREDRYHWSDLYIDTSVDALMVSVPASPTVCKPCKCFAFAGLANCQLPFTLYIKQQGGRYLYAS